MTLLRCVNCSHRFESTELDAHCERCGSAVLILGESLEYPSKNDLESLPPGVWRYGAFLPQVAGDEVTTLGEGATPLLRAERLAGEIGLSSLFLKDESRNPTGSFIDRGSTVLVSLARSRGIGECACVTTGNLGASLAAYCAKAGLAARISIHPRTDRAKLYQMLAFGAQIEATSKRSEGRSRGGRSLSVDAGNAYILEGEKTTGFEIVHDLGWKQPDVIVVPVGTGGHLSMIWRAIEQLRELGMVEQKECRLLGVQFAGSPPLVKGIRRRQQDPPDESFTELEESEPFFINEAARAMEASHGMGLTTTVSDTVRATGMLARTEGIFAEPASASVVASLQSAVARGYVRRSDVVVCVVTGSGLKDTKAISRLARPWRKVPVREDYNAARLQVGETKLELLRSIARRPSYAYQLWQQLSRKRSMTTASVYQHLSELEGFGLVRRSNRVVAGGRERVFYDLSRRGADFLKVAGKLKRS